MSVTLTTTNVQRVDPDDAKELRATIGKIRRLMDKRDEIVLRAHYKGASLREIADVAGMSHVGILKMVRRNEGETEELRLLREQEKQKETERDW